MKGFAKMFLAAVSANVTVIACTAAFSHFRKKPADGKQKEPDVNHEDEAAREELEKSRKIETSLGNLMAYAVKVGLDTKGATGK